MLWHRPAKRALPRGKIIPVKRLYIHRKCSRITGTAPLRGTGGSPPSPGAGRRPGLAYMLAPPVTLAGAAGISCANFADPGCISVGQTWYFQGWYRDASSPCSSPFNLSNGLEVCFTL